MYYTVCEVAKRLNLSPHTIRYYSKEGLLDFVERDQNGNRIFKESDFERLFIIASLKRAGTATIHDNMPPNIRRIKERIRRLTDDMEQFYKDASKAQDI